MDWFHISKKFQTWKNALGDTFEDSLERALGKLWQGKFDEALLKLDLLKGNITDYKQQSKLNELYQYIKCNTEHIVNYDERKRANQTSTSSVAESHIEAVFNARHQSSGQMPWTTQGAHHV